MHGKRNVLCCIVPIRRHPRYANYSVAFWMDVTRRPSWCIQMSQKRIARSRAVLLSGCQFVTCQNVCSALHVISVAVFFCFLSNGEDDICIHVTITRQNGFCNVCRVVFSGYAECRRWLIVVFTLAVMNGSQRMSRRGFRVKCNAVRCGGGPLTCLWFGLNVSQKLAKNTKPNWLSLCVKVHTCVCECRLSQSIHAHKIHATRTGSCDFILYARVVYRRVRKVKYHTSFAAFAHYVCNCSEESQYSIVH